MYLGVEMVKEDLQWKVYDYNYGIDHETTSPALPVDEP